jgi:hypothetical protein
VGPVVALTESVEQRFLPALAEQLAVWFPELGGRALAVSEVSITKENVPTLPLVMCAFLRSTSEARAGNRNFEIVDAFVVEFWLEPQRYKRADGSETPFWSYYPYEQIRETLLNNILSWTPPGCELIAYRGLNIEAEPLAVTLTFAFTAAFQFRPKPMDFGVEFTVGFNLCTPEGCIPEALEDVDPCAPEFGVA